MLTTSWGGGVWQYIQASFWGSKEIAGKRDTGDCSLQTAQKEQLEFGDLARDYKETYGITRPYHVPILAQ